MRQFAGTLNRGWLAVLGTALILGGVYVVLASFGLLPGPKQDSRLVSADAGPLLDRAWVAVGIAVLGVLLGLCALAWLGAQFPRANRPGPLRLHDDAVRGLTTCPPKALSDAVEDDLKALPGVASADAILRGTAKEPELSIRVGVDDRADLSAVLHSIRTDVVSNLSTALDTTMSRLAVRVDIEHGKRDTASITL